MLVLSRRKGEKIVIGNEIIIEILSVTGEGVRIGVTAPEATSVHRYEVFIEIQKANRDSEILFDEKENTALENLAELLRAKQQ
jgi:carbon storage regulator